MPTAIRDDAGKGAGIGMPAQVAHSHAITDPADLLGLIQDFRALV